MKFVFVFVFVCLFVFLLLFCPSLMLSYAVIMDGPPIFWVVDSSVSCCVNYNLHTNTACQMRCTQDNTQLPCVIAVHTLHLLSSYGWAGFWPKPMKFLVDMLNHTHWLIISYNQNQNLTLLSIMSDKLLQSYPSSSSDFLFCGFWVTFRRVVIKHDF